MDLQRIETPGLAHYAYLLQDGDHALVVDPRRDVDIYLRRARSMGARITHILETHRQEDFVMGSTHLASLSGALVVNGQHDCFGRGDIRLGDGEALAFGSMRIKAVSTPGHTPESMCYAIYLGNSDSAWCVFTGDTLFFGETGRTDLSDNATAAENAGLLYDSVNEKLAGLGDHALIMPAHGPGSVCGSGIAERWVSTLGDEKQYNPVFTTDRNAFAQTRGSQRLPRPPYFRAMERINLKGGIPMPGSTDAISTLNASEFSAQLSDTADTTVLDTREPEAYAGGHVEDTYSIWLDGLSSFGGWVAAENDRIALITDRNDDISQAVIYLNRIGFDNIVASLKNGFDEWRKSGLPISHCRTITPTELNNELAAYQILDVREPGEFSSAHIEGAKSMYVGDLEQHLDRLELDRNKPVAVTCSVGHRASLASSILRRKGFQDVRNLIGGMSAWQAMDLATTREN